MRQEGRVESAENFVILLLCSQNFPIHRLEKKKIDENSLKCVFNRIFWSPNELNDHQIGLFNEFNLLKQLIVDLGSYAAQQLFLSSRLVGQCLGSYAVQQFLSPQLTNLSQGSYAAQQPSWVLS